MQKSTVVNARIDPETKAKAEKILSQVGLSTAESIRLLFAQICLHNGLPFAVKIPNKETLDALVEIEAGKAHHAEGIDDLLNGDD